jgi:mono/diheme cytochrome c family protein
MAIGRALRSLLTAGAAALTLGAAGCTIAPAVPANPAFDTDVRPIFLAHCTRCHGAGPDGGTFNTAAVPNFDRGLTCPSTTGPNLMVYCALDSYGNKVCPPNPGAGAGFYATLKGSGLQTVLHEASGTCLQMPPPPAPSLDEWELAVVDAWVAGASHNNGQAVCSHSSNPDPALLCP